MTPRINAAAAGALALLWLAVGGAVAPVLADDPAAETNIRVSFSQSSGPGVPHYLVAQLTEPDGSAVPGQQVTFLREARFGGPVIVELGRAATDLGGYARLPILPRDDSYTLTARFAGAPDLGPSEVTTEVRFPTETIEHPERAPNGGAVDPRLRPLANWMPAILSGAVVVVWLVLIVVTVQTLRRIRSAGRDPKATIAQ